MADVWNQQAAQWERVGPPLRPSPEDLRHQQRVARGWAACGRAPRILLLGVTPELALLQWPQPRSLLAVDLCADMIARVWPRRPDCADAVVRADWLELPLADQSRDLVVSDGCFGVLGYPVQHRALLRSIRRVLTSDGRLVFRVFVRPQRGELATDVYDQAMAGRIGSFHSFKLRLLMALQADITSGVRTGEVWENWMTHGPRPRDLVAACGWKAEQIETIDAYRGQTTTYSFPTLGELRELASQEGFEELECAWPGYESGDRCPTLVLSRR
ncbi:MAG: class I SAM-dependent methyltransferase [Deltaproteobacteria bacterium]|nr:class I SAM-dependent methyltransferase [Deltaproteobacteria bacterium]